MVAIQARESIVGEYCRRGETGAVKLVIGITITRSGSVRSHPACSGSGLWSLPPCEKVMERAACACLVGSTALSDAFYRHNPDHSLRLPVDELSMYHYHVLLAF
jgi:hypothetical protein